MTIVLADTDVYFREKLKKRLAKFTGLHVVGESSGAEETTAMILNRKPDIAILNACPGWPRMTSFDTSSDYDPADHHHRHGRPRAPIKPPASPANFYLERIRRVTRLSRPFTFCVRLVVEAVDFPLPCWLIDHRSSAVAVTSIMSPALSPNSTAPLAD
jgi:DNA-binding NarL/FixJ family response regulator